MVLTKEVAMEIEMDLTPTMSRLSASDSDDYEESADQVVVEELSSGADKSAKRENEVKERAYQTFLIRVAQERNVIVCLPTGSGKTFIALQLAKHYLPEAIQQGRKIIFLANTVLLAHQQAEYFETRLTPPGSGSEKIVDCLTGDLDFWDSEDWARIFSERHVLIMTTDICSRALNHDYIHLNQIMLLVLDECHHTVGNSGMNQVMRRYRELLNKNGGRVDLTKQPRILGLTATIILGRGNEAKVASEVQQAEDRLCANAITYHDYEEVLKHSTDAKIEFVAYEKAPEVGALTSTEYEFVFGNLKQVKETTSSAVKRLANRLADEEARKIGHESLKSKDQQFATKKIRDKLKFLTSVIDDVLLIHQEFGLYCARLTAIHKRGYLYTTECNRSISEVEDLISVVETALEYFIVRAEKTMQWGREGENDQKKIWRLNKFRTDKVAKVVKILHEYEGDELRGIIFTTQRNTTQALSWYLRDLTSLPSSPVSFLKVGCIVGIATYGRDPIECRATMRGHKAMMEGFRKGDYNLLVATSVLEEGLDVPSCNLVMRVDSILNYPSFIQSMGRARSKTNSRFIAFIDRAKEWEERETYKRFQRYNLKLSEHLRRNALHADDDENQTFDHRDSALLPDFDPTGTGFPRIPASEAISITQTYCQLLPCDRFARLAPEYWWEKVKINGLDKFRVYVQFPVNSVIREVVVGEPQSSKALAKQSAALEACKLLHERGVLNEKLFPMRRHVTPQINEFMKLLLIEKEQVGDKKAGTKKRTQWYHKKVPKFVQGTVAVQSHTELSAYVIRIDLLNSDDGKLAELYSFRRRNHAYCILTPVSLDIVPQFVLKVNTTIGEVVVTLEKIRLTQDQAVYAHSELAKLRDFNRYIFGDLLGLSRHFMKPNYSSFLIAPLLRNSVGRAEFFGVDWGLIEKVTSIPDSLFNPPSEDSRRNFPFVRENYDDVVVFPWYKTEAKSSLNKCDELHVVLKVLDGTSPLSPFPNPNYPNYMSYFMNKYPSTVTFVNNKSQPLIETKRISTNLNFFTPGVNVKKSQLDRSEDKFESLIPELVTLYPLPASLFIQAKFLPSVIQRIYRFLCASEIRSFVAQGTPWSSCQEVQGGYEEELQYLWKSDKNSGKVEPPAKRRRSSPDATAAAVEVMETSPSVQEPQSVGSAKTDFVLDMLHPDELSRAVLDSIKMRTERFRRNRGGRQQEAILYLTRPTCLFDYKNIAPIPLKRSFDHSLLFLPEEQPSLFKIMQAITMDGSHDSVNLERLEMIGDSVLKYVVSLHIYVNFTDLDEGGLTEWRSRLISNFFLYSHGKKLPVGSLGCYLAGGKFQPKQAWVPPGFPIPTELVNALIENDVNDDILNDVNPTELEGKTQSELIEFVQLKKSQSYEQRISDVSVGYAHARVGDKSIADAMEALIGAYFVSGGIYGALHVMGKLGLRGPKNTDDMEGIPFGMPTGYRGPEYKLTVNDRVSKYLPCVQQLENLIGYKFTNPWLLVEAFTHPCYTRNRITGSYERLEFIGDAVLDFIITNHIYHANETLNPGQLTDLRSALVNNVTFGSLAVRCGLHTHLLNKDKALDDAISEFVKLQEANGHKVTGHFKLLSDSECTIVGDVDCPKVLGDIFESLAGAIFIDSRMSLDTVWNVFSRLMRPEIEEFSANVPKSPVRVLHEHHGAKVFVDVVDENPESTKPRGLACVALTLPVTDPRTGESKRVFGVGKNKSSAKLAAAKYYNKIFERRGVS